nr:hypothetical protein [Tanacetum cinerariifolium]GEV46148.1 hypothetical protein [Tanacetum cinerariifolium]
MTLALMAKAFTLNNTTPTNNNQRSSSNPSNMQIAQAGMNIDQDKQTPMVEDNTVENMNGRSIVLEIANQYGNGDMQIAQKEEARIQLTSEEFNFMAVAGACEETERDNPNCTLENNLQQALTSGTQSHKAPFYDTNRSAEGRGTVKQHPANVEETHALYDSLYNNLAIEVEKVNTVNRKLRETNADLTTELARYKN